MISSFFPRTAFVCILLCALYAPAHAQSNKATATAEDVAIAFFKTAETNPDFDLWAGGSSKYKSAAPARGKLIFQEEKQRLMRAWNEYDPQYDTLDIRTTVTLELKTVMDEKNNEHYMMMFDFDRDDAIYFPYSYQDYRIAVIPQLIEKMLVQTLDKNQYEIIRQRIGNGGKAALLFQLKPVKAYIQQPYIIDNTEQWMFLCDIATLVLRTPRDGVNLWNYGADWFVSPETEKLRDLYKSPTEAASPY